MTTNPKDTAAAQAELAELEREHDASVTPWEDFSAFCEQQAIADRMHHLRIRVVSAHVIATGRQQP